MSSQKANFEPSQPSQPPQRRGRLVENKRIKHYQIRQSSELQEFYQYKTIIGKGSFGIVYKAFNKKTEQMMALKIISKGELGTRKEDVEKEIRILKMVNHAHIIRLEEIYESQKKYFLVFELCYTTLHNYLKEHAKLFEEEIIRILKDLSGAVAYLHQNGIVHRDLKLENVLLTNHPNDPEDIMFVKITDFGLSTILTERSHKALLSTVCGTLAYMSPEIVLGQTYSQQCDIWSLGIITFLLLTGTFPFAHHNFEEFKEIVVSKDLDYSTLNASPEICTLLAKMLHKNPAHRITSTELEVHPYLNGNIGCDVESVFEKMKRWRGELRASCNNDPPDWLQQSTVSKPPGHSIIIPDIATNQSVNETESKMHPKASTISKRTSAKKSTTKK